MLEFKITALPLPYNRIAHMHWAQKKKHNDHWYALIKAAIRGRLPTKPLPKASLYFKRVSSREPDFDGLVSSFKGVVDGLVLAGVLENDRLSNTGVPTYVWEKGTKNSGYIHVKVTEVSPLSQDQKTI